MEAMTPLNNSVLPGFMTILIMELLDIPQSIVFSTFIFSILTYCLILLFTPCYLQLLLYKDICISQCTYCCLICPNVTLWELQLFTHSWLVVCWLRKEKSPTLPVRFLLHLYGGGSLSFLTVMAYDRYIAICKPLRYNNLMTPGTLVKLIFMAFFAYAALIGSSFVLTISREICRANIVDINCNNPSLMELICGDSRAMNAYGYFLVVLVQSVSILIVSITYLKILITCLSTKQAKSISKAVQTCGTHLVVFLSFEINTRFLMASHRLESVSPHVRRAFGISIIIFPPIRNPLIYGLKTREICQTVFRLIKRKVSSL